MFMALGTNNISERIITSSSNCSRALAHWNHTRRTKPYFPGKKRLVSSNTAREGLWRALTLQQIWIHVSTASSVSPFSTIPGCFQHRKIITTIIIMRIWDIYILGHEPTFNFHNPIRSFTSFPRPMLKLISSSSRIHNRLPSAAVTVLRPAAESNSPLLRVLSSLGGLGWGNGNSVGRLFFCSGSGSGDGSDQVVDAEVKAAESGADEAQSKASSAIVSTYPRPEDYLTVSVSDFTRFCHCL